MDPIFLLLFFGLMLIPMFLASRRARAHQQKIADFQSNLKVGDNVVTASGIHGQITRLGETDVDIEVAPLVRITMERIAIMRFADQPRDPHAFVPEENAAADSDDNVASAADADRPGSSAASESQMDREPENSPNEPDPDKK